MHWRRTENEEEKDSQRGEWKIILESIKKRLSEEEPGKEENKIKYYALNNNRKKESRRFSKNRIRETLESIKNIQIEEE